ncbi:MAG: DUF192 domain-containing protein [Candidatus Omnitrophica bacterium]|nr:DUF192 domain-containing protein [Candidatus Omnitrophota bacterium]
MKSRFFPFIIGVLFLGSGACAAPSAKKVCIGNVCVNAVIASSEQERAEGLMFKESLSENEGMFFVFERADVYSFWMKNMKFPLDLIWINTDKKIVDITRNAPPCENDPCPVFSPDQKIKYVLEVQAGFADKFKLRVGDSVTCEE